MKTPAMALAATLIAVACPGVGWAQAAIGPAIGLLKPAIAKPLVVTSPAFGADGDIPFENTQYRANSFPGLAWSKGPAATKSYAVIMQDTDVHRPSGPLVHWTLLKAPPTITSLDAGMTEPPAGAAYGPSFKGAAHAYLGPRTPPGPKHHYHFQVFALDKVLADPGEEPSAMMAAMKGHVLASGEIVGLGRAPE